MDAHACLCASADAGLLQLHDQPVLSCTPFKASDVRLLHQAPDVVALPLSSLLSTKLSLSSEPDLDPQVKVGRERHFLALLGS